MTHYKLLFSSKNRFLLLLRPDVALQQNRLLGTAAARQVPPVHGSRFTKSMSKLEKKAIVEDFVNKYRVINAGKFPTPKYVMEHVGGSYYTVRTILQEVRHDIVSSALPSAVNSSTMGKNDCSTAVVEKHGISAEFDTNLEEVVDKSICLKKVNMSDMDKNPEKPAEYVSRSERQVNLKHEGKSDEASAHKGTNVSHKISESPEVLCLSNMAENTSSGTAIVDHCKVPAIPEHTGTSENSMPEKVEEASAEVTRVTTEQRTKDMELHESSLWGNLKGFARNIISFWHKT